MYATHTHTYTHTIISSDDERENTNHIKRKRLLTLWYSSIQFQKNYFLCTHSFCAPIQNWFRALSKSNIHLVVHIRLIQFTIPIPITDFIQCNSRFLTMYEFDLDEFFFLSLKITNWSMPIVKWRFSLLLFRIRIHTVVAVFVVAVVVVVVVVASFFFFFLCLVCFVFTFEFYYEFCTSPKNLYSISMKKKTTEKKICSMTDLSRLPLFDFCIYAHKSMHYVSIGIYSPFHSFYKPWIK